MKKLILLLVLFLGLTSCRFGDEVLLPQGTYSVKKDMVDYSQLYFFFKTEGKDTLAETNFNNMISTTNWVLSIDKRLPLHKVIPEVVKLQIKKQKKNAHGGKNQTEMFFSYSDSVGKNLAFLPFKSVEFSQKIYHSYNYIKKYPDFHTGFENVSIDILKGNRVLVNDVLVTDANQWLFIQDYLSFLSENKTVLVYLNFDERLSFDDYMKFKLGIRALVNDHILLAPNEFIYDAIRLDKECGCLH